MYLTMLLHGTPETCVDISLFFMSVQSMNIEHYRETQDSPTLIILTTPYQV